MASSVNRDFDVPAGFIEEEAESQLYYEDLGEDDELWLIRIPTDIELSLLDRKKIFLSDTIGDANIKNIKTENGKLLECFSESCEIPNLNVVLPQKANKKLCTVNKTFKGTILISEGFALEENKEIKLEEENRLKEIKSENEQNENTEGKKKKKKKRHSRHSESSDINYETEDAEKVSSSIRKKHDRKHSDTHKTKSLDVEIKNEPLSMDLDSFPACNSQKQ